MSEAEEQEQVEKVPAIGDAVLVADEDGETFNEYHITEAFDFDETSGLYKVSCDNGEEYNVYWSDEESSWVHSDD